MKWVKDKGARCGGGGAAKEKGEVDWGGEELQKCKLIWRDNLNFNSHFVTLFSSYF